MPDIGFKINVDDAPVQALIKSLTGFSSSFKDMVTDVVTSATQMQGAVTGTANLASSTVAKVANDTVSAVLSAESKIEAERNKAYSQAESQRSKESSEIQSSLSKREQQEAKMWAAKEAAEQKSIAQSQAALAKEVAAFEAAKAKELATQEAEKRKEAEAAERAAKSEAASQVLMTSVQAKNAAERERLSKMEYQDIGHEIDALRIKKQDLESTMTRTVDKETKERLKLEKAEVVEALRFANAEYQKRPQVAHEGKGAEHGVMGVGRELIGSAAGSLTGALGPLAGLAGGALATGGVAAAGAALEGLIEKGKAAAERAEELKIGLMSAGMGGEEAEKALKKVKSTSVDVAHEFAINKGEVESATAAYLKMGGTTDNLKQKQEDIAALAKKSGMDMEGAAKMYAKAGDPENQANLKKFGINLAGVTDEAERARIIHEKLAGTIAGMKEAADGPVGGFNRMKESLGEITGAIAGVIFTALGPLFQLLGEVGKIIQDYIVPVVKVLINIALWPMQESIKILTSIVKAWFGTLIDIYAWIGKVTGITKFLISAWEGLQDVVKGVIEWFEKAKKTVTDMAGSVLSLLGITEKESDAEKKNKEETEKNAKAKEAAAKATDAAAKASDDYTASLIKNADEADKSAKQGQDNAIAAIRDIKKRLETATGSEKAMLEERLKGWVDYGKRERAEQEKGDKATQDAKDAIYGKEVVAAKSQGTKVTKSKFDAQKEAEAVAFAEKKAAISQQQLDESKSDEWVKNQLEQAQLAHDQKMLDIAKDNGQKISAELEAVNKDKSALRKQDQDKQIADAKSATQDELDALDKRAVDEHLSAKVIADETYRIKHDALKALIDLEAGFGRPTLELQKQLSAMELAQYKSDKKQTEDEAKKSADTLAKIDIAEADASIAVMKDGDAKQKAIENARYQRELQAKTKEITDAKLLALTKESLEIDHKNKLAAIDKASQDKRDAQAREFIVKGIELMQGSWKDRLASVKGFLMQELQQFAITNAAKVISTQTSQLAQTASVVAGVAARGVELAAEGVASAASAAGTWIATAAKAAYNAFETLPFPLDILGAAGAIGSVVLLASQVPKLFKHSEGGMIMSPRIAQTIGGNSLLHGEAGPEIDIPLHKVPGFINDVTGNQFASAIAPMHDILRSIANNTANPTAVMPMNASFESARNQHLRNEDRRSIGR